MSYVEKQVLLLQQTERPSASDLELLYDVKRITQHKQYFEVVMSFILEEERRNTWQREFLESDRFLHMSISHLCIILSEDRNLCIATPLAHPMFIEFIVDKLSYDRSTAVIKSLIRALAFLSNSSAFVSFFTADIFTRLLDFIVHIPKNASHIPKTELAVLIILFNESDRIRSTVEQCIISCFETYFIGKNNTPDYDQVVFGNVSEILMSICSFDDVLLNDNTFKDRLFAQIVQNFAHPVDLNMLSLSSKPIRTVLVLDTAHILFRSNIEANSDRIMDLLRKYSTSREFPEVRVDMLWTFFSMLKAKEMPVSERDQQVLGLFKQALEIEASDQNKQNLFTLARLLYMIASSNWPLTLDCFAELFSTVERLRFWDYGFNTVYAHQVYLYVYRVFEHDKVSAFKFSSDMLHYLLVVAQHNIPEILEQNMKQIDAALLSPHLETGIFYTILFASTCFMLDADSLTLTEDEWKMIQNLVKFCLNHETNRHATFELISHAISKFQMGFPSMIFWPGTNKERVLSIVSYEQILQALSDDIAKEWRNQSDIDSIADLICNMSFCAMHTPETLPDYFYSGLQDTVISFLKQLVTNQEFVTRELELEGVIEKVLATMSYCRDFIPVYLFSNELIVHLFFDYTLILAFEPEVMYVITHTFLTKWQNQLRTVGLVSDGFLEQITGLMMVVESDDFPADYYETIHPLVHRLMNNARILL